VVGGGRWEVGGGRWGDGGGATQKESPEGDGGDASGDAESMPRKYVSSSRRRRDAGNFGRRRRRRGHVSHPRAWYAFARTHTAQDIASRFNNDLRQGMIAR
jgi:hypothetical protein